MISTCPKRSEDYSLYICPYFRKLRVQARRELVTQKSLCDNCLITGHLATHCRSRRCFKCRRNRHTMLYVKISPVSSSQPCTSAGFVNNHVRKNQTLLPIPTVLLFISDSNNVPQLCRALLDSGAQETLITESCI
jgi:hypothetical protein